jgi:radical SAM protein with 4Fe4S-binding SPASM domain
MPFCYSPWTNLDIDPAGSISPCCKFQKKYYIETFNVQNDSIMTYLDSNLLQKVKQEFNQNQWPAGCERCRIEEENGIASKRQLDWDKWNHYYKNYDLRSNNFITASVAFGNTCNLKCITCSSYSSSRWQQEYREIYKADYPHVQFYRQDFVDRFTELAPGLIHLDVPGGEPFISGVLEQQALLQYYVDTGRSNNMSLHYTTNATIFPDKSWWKLWSQFKEIDLQISIDGVGSRYEYIRFPAEWSTLVNNVEQYLAKTEANFRLSVSHTVSAYNVYYLDEFFSWCYNIGLPRPWLGRVHRPVHMSPTVWSAATRKFIADHLNNSQYNDVKQWAQLMANNDDSEYFDEFKKKLQLHDQHRKLDFANTFPELANYI